MARIAAVGIGAYPEDAYFDKDRPSWLPYWIDTPTESEMKYGATNIIQATVNAGSMAAGTVVGGAANAVGQAAGTAAGGMFGSLDWKGVAVIGALGLLAYGAYFRR